MLIIVLYYLFLAVFLLPFGVVTERILKIQNHSLPITLILGLVFQTVLFTIAAFFIRLNVEIFTVNVFLFLVFLFWCKNLIKTKLNLLVGEFLSWSKFFKVVFFLLVILVLAKSSLLPFVVDNESYYIQTIKWFSEYGFVKGLGNLHIFLAQGSSWHVLQAGLNFSFLTDIINDINGFVFIVCSFYYLNEYQKQNQQTWIVYLLMFSVLIFQFLDAPSPDLPMLLLLSMIFYWYVEQKNSKLGIILFVFLVYIKIVVAPLVLLFLFWSMDRSKWRFLCLLGLIFAALWLAKNSILSGYPLYPFTYFSLSVDWLVPKDFLLYMMTAYENAEYFDDVPSGYQSFGKKIIAWVGMGGITGIFNKLILLLFMVFPFTRSFKKQKPFKILYFILLLHFIALLFTSPQFRFFLPAILFFGAVIMNEVLIKVDVKSRLGKPLFLFGVLLPVVFLFPINLSGLTRTANHQTTDAFEVKQLLYPKPTSKFYEWEYEKKQRGNLEYFSPVEKEFYNTGNGDLPCITDAYLDYLEFYFHFLPQLRGNTLKYGFYSQPTF